MKSVSRAGREYARPVVAVRYDDGVVHEFQLDSVQLGSFEHSVPWRRFRSHQGQRHYPGSYASVTMGGFVVYESRLELARLMMADFDPSIVRIYAQPCWMAAREQGRVRRHVPDFLLVTAAGTGVLVNVKPAELLEDPKIAEALAWPGRIARRLGWQYEVWSGADPVVLANIRFLAGYQWSEVVPAEEVERARELVVDGEQIAVAERRLAGNRPGWRVRPALMALLWRGVLVTDLSRPLSGASVLRRAA
jgi:hypothetical protein